MKKITATILLSTAVMVAGCTSAEQTGPTEDTVPVEPTEAAALSAPALPHWTFSPEMIFPADQSLNCSEGGVALPDGRLIVTDQISGLRLVEADGSSRPFGQFAEAGYEHNPPEIESCANGVTLEPTGTHILVADIFQGAIYRVEIATEATEKIYQHPFGVNVARADSQGGTWFTQSARKDPDSGEEGLFRAVEVFGPDGAVYYLPPAGAGEPRRAVALVDDLVFANGLALDETGGSLYVATTGGGKVWRFAMDVASGTLSDRTVVRETHAPDNLEFDAHGRLWIAMALRSEIVVFDPASQTAESVFRISTPKSEQLLESIEARIAEGTPWLDLMVPGLWEPGPGLITGMILSPDDGPVYASGLGNALIKLER